MNREEMLGPVVSPETGKAYEPGTGYKGVGIGVGIVVILGMKLCHSAITGGTPPDLATQLATGVAEARAELPLRVDQITTITAISAAGTRIVYDMRLEVDIPSAEIAAARAEQQTFIERAACDTADTRRMLEAGATIAYRYTDQTGDRFETEVRTCRRN